MDEWMISVLHEFRRNFQVADAIDIVLITVLLYSLLVWFKARATRGIFVGSTVLALIYIVARAFDLYLTTLVFHAGFAVLLVILVILFQEDLRRFLERLASIGKREPRRQGSHPDEQVNKVVEAVFHLAAQKIGALIVCKGREPVERHLDGGIVVGGRCSSPLLYSIFDTSSPGHDGAVLLDRGQIEQFAAHLPISTNRRMIGGRGTRHSAALGISERSDAIAIAVSEERGAVSVAEAGELAEITTPTELTDRLVAFYEQRFPSQVETSWKKLITRHAPLKLLALALACLAWFVLAYQPSIIQRTFVVPIEYRDLCKQLVLDEYVPTEARITVSGSERAFRFFEPSKTTVSINMGHLRAGPFEYPISDKNLRLPASLQLYRIEPRVIEGILQNVTPNSTFERKNGSMN
jgi:uncharacterized protein (TIGR00159 family)